MPVGALFGGPNGQADRGQASGVAQGWKPDTELTEGIKRTVDWLRGILDPQPAALARA